MAVRVAAAAPRDLFEAAAVIHRAFATLTGRIDPPSAAMNETPETLAARFDRGGAVFVARLDGEIVGAVCADPKADGSLYLDRLAVDPALTGKGIARALIEAVEAFGLAQDHDRVTLGVRLLLTDNIALFRHLGYAETGRKAHPGFSEPTSMDMAKSMRPA
ncbi:GNAT family N-acetyltransferase [Thalassobaculum sp. OXR-137]|uniref:GNAT family N-acetyltransferase n=1 Tax=Thalassobaculum sp. OXR-137 TaxID=3100173 RepID=UPI002AC957E7|nr:GNAT family N-acetyltransferase [Thalassobaculum sp. OXR-137]WPZ35989.1 GNAT family N-acetyltransferase [Thalassobaculum sp. OXR-137]